MDLRSGTWNYCQKGGVPWQNGHCNDGLSRCLELFLVAPLAFIQLASNLNQTGDTTTVTESRPTAPFGLAHPTSIT